MQGLAALRMWGQTGDRPTVWIAAADPVYLEPRLDHLVPARAAAAGIPPSDLRPLFDHLQEPRWPSDQRFGFARLGQCGYLRAEAGISTAIGAGLRQLISANRANSCRAANTR